jgi:hypothetical protein
MLEMWRPLVLVGLWVMLTPASALASDKGHAKTRTQELIDEMTTPGPEYTADQNNINNVQNQLAQATSKLFTDVAAMIQAQWVLNQESAILSYVPGANVGVDAASAFGQFAWQDQVNEDEAKVTALKRQLKGMQEQFDAKWNSPSSPPAGASQTSNYPAGIPMNTNNNIQNQLDQLNNVVPTQNSSNGPTSDAGAGQTSDAGTMDIETLGITAIDGGGEAD